MRAVRSGVYNIHFGPARPGLFSSQTYKSLGGGECDGTRKLHLLYSRVWSTVPCIQLRCYCHVHSLSLVHRHSVQVAGKIRPGVLCAATRVQ